MDVVLLKTVPALGAAGETKHVAAGYAKNFLLARGLAVLPGDPQAKQIVKQLERLKSVKKALKDSEVAQASEWAGKQITISGKASPDGTLYAAVTQKDVAKQLGLDAKKISFESVKTAGVYDAQIDLGGSAMVVVKVNVQTQS